MSGMLADLQALRNHFEKLADDLAQEQTKVHLRTERSTVFSRFSNRRIVPHPHPPQAAWKQMISGLEINPRIADDPAKAIACFDLFGSPVVNKKGKPFLGDLGQISTHVLTSESSNPAIEDCFNKANRWGEAYAGEVLPKLFPERQWNAKAIHAIWADIVLAALCLSESALTDKPKWYVQLTEQVKFGLQNWKQWRKNPFFSSEEMAAIAESIGDLPEDFFTTREDFVADSVDAIEILSRLLAEPATAEPPPKTIELVKGGIRINETTYALSKTGLEIMKVLLEADGEYVSLAAHGFRTRQIEPLPDPVKAIIDSQPGAGTRIKR